MESLSRCSPTLWQVVEHFGLTLSPDEFMMRCSVCNGHGYVLLSRAEAARRADCPPKVLESVNEFYACRACGKLYWEGPKSNNAFDHFSDVFDGFGAVRSIAARSTSSASAEGTATATATATDGVGGGTEAAARRLANAAEGRAAARLAAGAAAAGPREVESPQQCPSSTPTPEIE